MSKSLTEHAQILQLRESNDRLNRQLLKEKNRTQLLCGRIELAVQDALSGLDIPPVPKPPAPSNKRAHGEEKAIALFSDLQLSKVTPSYNSDVAGERVRRFADKIRVLTDIQRSDHPVNELRVYALGDMVEGEMIFPHQPFQIDASLVRQVFTGGHILANFVRTLAAYFNKVHVVCVPGNHGSLVGGRGNRFSPETNMDRMLYLFAKEVCDGEPRITWEIPWEKHEAAWYAVDYPFLSSGSRRVGFLLFHGHQIPGGANHSDGTIARHIYGWASGAVKESFVYPVYGHWHRPRSSRFNKFRFWANGSVESTNTYAQERLAAVGFPEQYLLFCNQERVTAEYLVDLS